MNRKVDVAEESENLHLLSELHFRFTVYYVHGVSPFRTTKWSKKRCRNYIFFPDGYDTTQMILEWIEGPDAVEVSEDLQMPQFIMHHDPKPQGCVKRYKTGEVIPPCSHSQYTLPAPCFHTFRSIVPPASTQNHRGVSRDTKQVRSQTLNAPSPCSLLPDNNQLVSFANANSPEAKSRFGHYYIVLREKICALRGPKNLCAIFILRWSCDT